MTTERVSDQDIESWIAVSDGNQNEPARFGLPNWGVVYKMAREIRDARALRAAVGGEMLVEARKFLTAWGVEVGCVFDTSSMYKPLASLLTRIRDAETEECAKVAVEAAKEAKDDDAEERKMLGKDYDPNCFGSGYSSGASDTATEIATAIRARIGKEG
jgi:hypothetical protein